MIVSWNFHLPFKEAHQQPPLFSEFEVRSLSFGKLRKGNFWYFIFLTDIFFIHFEVGRISVLFIGRNPDIWNPNMSTANAGSRDFSVWKNQSQSQWMLIYFAVKRLGSSLVFMGLFFAVSVWKVRCKFDHNPLAETSLAENQTTS